MINDEKNSVALNRFLEDILNAQKDLKWIDYAAHHINHKIHLDKYESHVTCHFDEREKKTNKEQNKFNMNC